jgi:hypothetical protein
MRVARRRCDLTAARLHAGMASQLHRLGCGNRQDRVVEAREVFGVERCFDDRGRCGVLRLGVFSGIGGRGRHRMAAGLEEDNDGLGAVGGYKELREYTDLGGQLMCSRCPTNNYKRATA